MLACGEFRNYAAKLDMDAAIRDFDISLELDQKNASTYYIRGWAYAIKDDKDAALRDLDKALELGLDPEVSKAVEELRNKIRQ